MILPVTPPVLLMPAKGDAERSAVAQAWVEHGGEVRFLGKYWEKSEELNNRLLKVYGNDIFARLLADLYGMYLISPVEEDICNLERWTGRIIKVCLVKEMQGLNFPLFVKSLIPKQFVSKVYLSFNELISESGVTEQERVLYSCPIEAILAEARAFVLNRQILDLAVYEGSEDALLARMFLEKFLADAKVDLPEAIVLDLAYTKEKQWFLMEWNAAWGAGLNGCKAYDVMPCIAQASGNLKK